MMFRQLIARGLSTAHDSFGDFLQYDRELDALLDECAGNGYASAAVAPLRTHCRRFWYFYRERLRLSGEVVVELGPLAGDDGPRLFVERAQRHLVFQVSEQPQRCGRRHVQRESP